LTSHAFFSAFSPEQPVVSKIDEGIQAGIGLEIDAPAIAAIAAIRPAQWDEFLPPEADTAIAARAGLDLDGCFVYELHGDLPEGSK
jgi:hypothetical protein